jgi:pilus assembly protein CpaB
MGSAKKLLFVSMGLGLLAGALAWGALRTRQRKVEARWATVKILCAAADVPEGAELAQEMVAIREFPAQFVTASFIKVSEDGKLLQDSPVGQRLAVPLKAGDPILVSHFEAAREAEFSAMISPRGRAVAIEVQERGAVGLWVRPNDHVDVIGSFRDPGGQEMKTLTLLQNVVVLATGRVTANTTYVPDDQKHFQTVTLLVLPEEAQILALAQELGQLTLLLRNPADLDLQEKKTVIDQKTLFAGDRASELQQKRYRTIQIIRGNRSVSSESAGIAVKQ